MIDSDGDDLPGFTVNFSGGTTNVGYTRARDNGALINGHVSPDGRHRADFVANVEAFQLRCERDPCTQSSTELCPMSANAARFLKLEERAYSCDEVIRAVEGSGYVGLGPVMNPGC